MMRWFDAHCHLQFDGQGAETVERARQASVEKLVCVGTDPDTSREAVALAKTAGDGVYATVGLHPHDAKNGVEDVISLLDTAIAEPDNRIVGIGECGLDYYYEHSPRHVQRDVFARQIYLAAQHDLSLVIHTRNAWDDTFAILRSEGIPSRTVIHCFTGGPEECKKAVDLGLYVSFSGITTFRNATDVQDAARFCPVDRLTIETDSPFLAPVPLRGKPNEPANLVRIGEFISQLRNTQVSEFSEAVYANTERLFKLQ